ncbi:MAG: sulfurtransferase, partial [Flavobacteriaceae bacterium]|nr:sulfurtransferase [Flavobacteriaceae bacterium]
LSQQKNGYIIDVREAQRYNGENEPFDPIAGHIPDARNIPFSENLTDNGLFLSQETLQKKYAPIFEKYKPEEIVVHCGSGVTACHTLLAINYAGFEIPNLYVGSWSEWCRNSKEMITK